MGNVSINIIDTYEPKYPFNWLMVASVKGFWPFKHTFV
jgi:hypothetical protein